MSTPLPSCPQCSSEYTYEMGALYVCPECAHEWSSDSVAGSGEIEDLEIKDAVGNPLDDGDAVIVVKNLPLKGGLTIKSGTKVRNIRLVRNATDDHNIDCRIDGIGAVSLKSSVVRKA
ncbi:MAG: alkylphosphonate utilization protein [Nocardiaceae bacterium]|nr:alkylphosphonate utilization protein [Nocardiaceae bacterium]